LQKPTLGSVFCF